jgi:uncharacterized membrane protein YdfJ with MMPL/SSD domain
VVDVTATGKECGFAVRIGLAVAVLLDATLIRGVLLPAAMKLLGDWNWYLPRWVEWLPRLTVEPELREEISESPAVPAA